MANSWVVRDNRIVRRPRRGTADRGFTFVEIMIVVAVLMLIMAMAIPNVARARKNAEDSKAVKDLQSIYTAIVIFRAANNRAPANWVELSPYVAVNTAKYELNPTMAN